MSTSLEQPKFENICHLRDHLSLDVMIACRLHRSTTPTASLFTFISIVFLNLTMATASASSTSSSSVPSKKGLPYPTIRAADDRTPKLDVAGNILSVPTMMNYVTPDTKIAHVRRDISGSDSGITDTEWKPATVEVCNARSQHKTIHENGFELLESPLPSPIDFLDTQQVIQYYYPDCESLLKTVLGDKVAVVKAFDHNIRISTRSVEDKLKGGGEAKPQVPLAIVHGDYTKDSGPRRLDDLSKPPKANDVLKQKLGETPLLDPTMVQDCIAGKRRFALINVWRSIDTENDVEELPLACVDANTASRDDLRLLQIHYPDRVGENYFVVPSSKHNWCYFPKMKHSEAMLIKQWDSFGAFALGTEQGPSTFAIHSAFLDPTTDESLSAPRKSIEVRCAVIWEED